MYMIILNPGRVLLIWIHTSHSKNNQINCKIVAIGKSILFCPTTDWDFYDLYNLGMSTVPG